jgi:hypothetical protein
MPCPNKPGAADPRATGETRLPLLVKLSRSYPAVNAARSTNDAAYLTGGDWGKRRRSKRPREAAWRHEHDGCLLLRRARESRPCRAHPQCARHGSVVDGVSYRVYPNRRWLNPMASENPFMAWLARGDGYVAFDARANFFTNHYSIIPGMLSKTPGKGANYMIAWTDSDGFSRAAKAIVWRSRRGFPPPISGRSRSTGPRTALGSPTATHPIARLARQAGTTGR